MRACVRLRGPDGRWFELVHGDVIGRLASAAMPLDDARVSEAHAMISLREGELRLIALRGLFAVDGHPVSEATLRPGMQVLLAQDLPVEVEEVQLPATVLGLEGSGLRRQVLPGVCSVVAGPRLVAGFVEDAAAWIWSDGDGWRFRVGQGPAADLAGGDALGVGDLRAVHIPIAAAGQAATRRQGAVDAPLRIIARFDTVHIHREGVEVGVLSGLLARIVSELVSLGGPVHWATLAAQLWPREADADVVRSRLDVNLSRLRRRLKELRVRADLVRTDGAGSIELLTYAHDVIEDQT